MKAVKITVDVSPRYINTVEDRIFLSVGQKLTGTVVLDGPGRPKSCQIRWIDARGRLLGRTSGKLDAYQRVIRYEFDLNQSWFPVHFIECDIDGKLQPVREKFFVSPTTDGWETLPAVTWATYPFGDLYDKLQQVGVNGIISYGMAPFDHVVEHGMKCYVDQCTFWEISTYHRPFRQFWEPPADYTGRVSPQSPGFGHNWTALLERYARVRARCKKEGRMISRDDHYRKVLLRAFCPNDPGTLRDAGERFAAVVRQHKGFRPLFHNIADEAGITDQSKPFDFCYCPYCMDKFRNKLQKAYGSLAELNRQWATPFKTWAEVYPLTTDETMDANEGPALRKSKQLNFAAWADHREFMDDTFTEFFRELRRLGQTVDPIGYFATGGCQWPDVFGGWDFCKLTRDVDALIPYNGGGNQEIIRSVAPAVKNVSPFFGDDPRQVRQMWFSIIHGDAGVVFWDNDEEKGRFVARPSGKIVNRGKLFGPALREFRGGLGQQMQQWTRADDPIGMLYSQPSERADWMLEALSWRDQPGAGEWFRHTNTRRTDVRMSWQQLIEDRQLQYRYLSYLDIEDGQLDAARLAQFKLIILPEALALSDRLVAALKQFVLDGGTLVADGRVGRMTANCRQIVGETDGADGSLDDLFGVRSGKALDLKPAGKLVAKKDACPWLGKNISALTALDRSVRLAPGSGAESAATAAGAPALIRRRVGRGWACYLNVDVATYQMDRHELGKPRGQALRDLLDAVVKLAGIQPRATLADQTLGTTAGIELTRFAQRGAEMYAAIMNRQFRQSGIGEKLDEHSLEVFETDRKVTMSFANGDDTEGPQHLYNARTGKYLGQGDTVQQTLPCLTPLVIARLPYRVDGLDVQLSPAGPAVMGQPVELKVVLRVGPQASSTPVMLPDHVIHVDVYQPDGTWCYWYSDNLVAREGVGNYSFIPALNDPKGNWKLVIRDSVTGTTVEKTLRVKGE